MTSYIDNLPQDIPLALFQSAVGAACISLICREPMEQTVRKVLRAVATTVMCNFVTAPFNNYLFSQTSGLFRKGSTFAITLLFGSLGTRLARLESENLSLNNWSISSIVLGYILNANKMPGAAIAMV